MEERWRAESSPVFRVIWEQDVDLDAFDSTAADMPAPVRAVMDGSVAIVRRRKKDGTLYGPDAAIARRWLRNWPRLDSGACAPVPPLEAVAPDCGPWRSALPR